MEQDFNEKHWSNPCPKYDCRKAACKCGLEYVNIPASLGDDSEGSDVAPKNGAYCNALVVYEANNHIYIYSKEGIPKFIEASIPKWVADDIEELHDHIGSPKTLTVDDYNWNSTTQDETEPFNTVALWKLAPGLYFISGSTSINAKTFKTKSAGAGLYIVSGTSTIKRVYELDEKFTYLDKNYHLVFPMHEVNSDGSLKESFDIASRKTIESVMSDHILSGETAPTPATPGETGSVYVDTSSEEAYICIKKNDNSYLWKQIT